LVKQENEEKTNMKAGLMRQKAEKNGLRLRGDFQAINDQYDVP